MTKKAGLFDPSSKSLGVALLDYDDDGWIDLFVANDTQPNKLYHNNHNGTFTESAFAAGVAFSDAGKARAGMGTDAADYDLSGRQGWLSETSPTRASRSTTTTAQVFLPISRASGIDWSVCKISDF